MQASQFRPVIVPISATMAGQFARKAAASIFRPARSPELYHEDGSEFPAS
jgi:hypothetical protein